MTLFGDTAFVEKFFFEGVFLYSDCAYSYNWVGCFKIDAGTVSVLLLNYYLIY